MAQIWIVQPGAQVTIKLNFTGTSAGQFGLTAISLHGGATDLAQVGQPGPLGQSTYTITPTDNLSFSMSAVCTFSPAGAADAMVTVSQGGVVVPCVNAMGKVKNGSPGAYAAMKIGSVPVGANAKVFNFQVLR